MMFLRTIPELVDALGGFSAVAEMVGMIHAMRMYEANQKVIQTQDERMGRVISDLGGNPGA